MNYLDKDIAKKFNIEYTEIETPKPKESEPPKVEASETRKVETPKSLLPVSFEGDWCQNDEKGYNRMKNGDCKKEQIIVKTNSVSVLSEGVECSLKNVRKTSSSGPDIYAARFCSTDFNVSMTDSGDTLYIWKTPKPEDPKTEPAKVETPKKETTELPSTVTGYWCKTERKEETYEGCGKGQAKSDTLAIWKEVISNNPVRTNPSTSCSIKSVRERLPNIYIVHDFCGNTTELALNGNDHTLKIRAFRDKS
jgi:hypothetical protein